LFYFIYFEKRKREKITVFCICWENDTVTKGKSTAMSLNQVCDSRITDAECGSTSLNLFGPNGSWVTTESQITSQNSGHFCAPVKACQTEDKCCWHLCLCLYLQSITTPSSLIQHIQTLFSPFIWAISAWGPLDEHRGFCCICAYVCRLKNTR